MFIYGIIFATSFIVSLLFILLFIKLFYKFWILDNPAKYKLKRKPIPYSMGVVFFCVLFLVSFFTMEHTYKLILVWIFGFVITVVSFFDDRMNLSPKIRLIIQIIIGAVIWITSIKIGYISNIFWWILELETYHITLFSHTIYLIPLLFTIIWYVFVFNALNWTDGISWNTSGLSIVSFFILFLLGMILFARDNYIWWVNNAEFIMKMSVILCGSLIPFWYFDVRQKILMGDSGTMFLGFMLATLAIIAGGKVATVLVVFWIYSVDAIYVIINRILHKKNPLKWDFTHLHHRLKDIGLSHYQILGLVYGLSLLFWVTALFLSREWKIVVFVVIVFVVVFINKIIKISFKK